MASPPGADLAPTATSTRMNHDAILTTGRNCWRTEHADRVRFLIDGADYFHAFRETAKNARRSILILGWDINSRFALERTTPDDGLPTTLREFLNALVKRNRALRIHVLDWNFPIIFAPDREWLPLYKLDWTTHRRLRFRLDSQHPVGGSHHQKVAVVDDRVAFAGGLDFTFGRWDTPEHRSDDERRRDDAREMPQPYHDVQMMLSGPAAGALGDLVRERWRRATGQILQPTEATEAPGPWPGSIEPDATDVETGIARTVPRYKDQAPVREVQQLVLDAIATARDTLYIENQYLTAPTIGQALEQRLAEDDGPEIVIVLPLRTVGWLSQYTMDVLRERLLKRLYATDHERRLRVYYPDVPGLGEQCINVHAKVLIRDDTLVRIGSANFNNRSMGLDTECDLAFEARSAEHLRAAIASLRARLLGEHLGVSPAAVERAIAAEGSLIGAVESLRGGERSLRPLPLSVPAQVDAVVPDTPIADPEQPIDTDYLAAQLLSQEEKPSTRRSLLTLSLVLLAALALAASWRWTPLSQWLDVNETLSRLAALRGNWLAPVVVVAIYVVGGLLLFPATLLIVATGVAFGAVEGFAYALLGAEVSAIVTFAVGQWLGHATLRRLSHHTVARVSQRLARQGLLAVITLRVVPVAPFSVINLVAGASHIRFRDFALGSLIGMAPGVLVLTLFSDQVAAAVQAPKMVHVAAILALGAVLLVGTWAANRWFAARRRRRHD